MWSENMYFSLASTCPGVLLLETTFPGSENEQKDAVHNSVCY